MMVPSLGYAFRSHGRTRDGFVRMLNAISVRALSLSRLSRRPKAGTIHEARLLIKRARALLWFAKPALKATVYKHALVRLRKAARLLAGQRDLEITRLSLSELAQQKSRQHDGHALKNLVRRFDKDTSPTGPLKKSLPVITQKALRVLVQVLKRITCSTMEDSLWPATSDRVTRAFHAMIKAGKKARGTKSDTDFHTWRKKAKRLFYQLELSRLQPGKGRAQTRKQAEKLQKMLGAQHDCFVVERRLRKMNCRAATHCASALLKKRKRLLRKKACLIARKIDSQRGLVLS